MSMQSFFSSLSSLFTRSTASTFKADCPDEIIFMIMQHLSTKDAVSFQTTSKKMRAVFIGPNRKIYLEAKTTNLLFKKIMEVTSKPIKPIKELNTYFLILVRFSPDFTNLTFTAIDGIPPKEETAISNQFALKVTIKKTDSSCRHQISQIGFPNFQGRLSEPDIVKRAFQNLNDQISTNTELMCFDLKKVPSALDIIASWYEPSYRPPSRSSISSTDSVFIRLNN